MLALTLSGVAHAEARSDCALVDWRVEDARMQTLEASQSDTGCRIHGVAPTAEIAGLQQRALAMVAEANCAAIATPGAVTPAGGGASAGHGFTLLLAPPAGGGVCLQPPHSRPAAPQAGVDIMSRTEHPAVYPEEASARDDTGIAMVMVLVDPDAAPVLSLISRSTGVPALDAAALAASERWTYMRIDEPREPGLGLVLVPVPFEAD